MRRRRKNERTNAKKLQFYICLLFLHIYSNHNKSLQWWLHLFLWILFFCKIKSNFIRKKLSFQIFIYFSKINFKSRKKTTFSLTNKSICLLVYINLIVRIRFFFFFFFFVTYLDISLTWEVITFVFILDYWWLRFFLYWILFILEIFLWFWVILFFLSSFFLFTKKPKHKYGSYIRTIKRLSTTVIRIKRKLQI